MTCVVAVVHDGKIYMAGDSMASSGYDRRVTGLRKVFRVGQFLIGYTSSFRMAQLLQYSLEVRQQQDGETDERYMVVAFAEAAREVFKAKGYATIKDNTESGGSFLVGYKGHLYEVNSDYQVNTWVDHLAAVGAGQAYALATLIALHDWQPMDRLRRALEIASELSVYVTPPYIFEVLE